MQILIRQHAKGGTLEFSDDKPIDLVVREFSGDDKPISPKGDAEPPLTSNNPKSGAFKTPELKSVDPGQAIYSEKSPSLVGKNYSGQIDGDKVNLKFGENGKVEFTGERAGPADYKVLITSITMESEYTKYDGKISGDTISGDYERIKGPNKGERGKWHFSLIDKFVGTFGYSDNTGQYTSTLNLKADGTGTLEMRDPYDNSKWAFDWSVNEFGVAVKYNDRVVFGRARPSEDGVTGYRPIGAKMLWVKPQRNNEVVEEFVRK
jgi:hypothetical protein